MNKRSDVLIIGGGAIGICAAHYLQKAGHKVTVIEKRDIGSGCSYGNAGLVVPSHFIPLAAPGVIAKGLKWMLHPESPFYIKPRLNLELFSWLRRFRSACTEQHVRKCMPLLRDLHLASLSLYEELSKELKDGFDFWQQGLLMLYTTEGGRLECSEMVEQAEKMGVRARLLNTGEIRELDANIRTHAPGGAYYPQDSHIDPARFVVNLAKHVQGNDDTIQVATDVLDFEAVNGKIETVRTSKGDFSADQIVLTAGAWSPTLIRNLKLKLPIQPAKGYSITLNHTQDIPQIPLILEEAKVAVTPLGDRLRFAGTLELAGLDLSFNMRRVHAVLKAVPRYLDTEPVNLEQAEIWAGLRPCTPDGLPIIGRCPSINNLIVATGHAMIGISLAPITGKLIAELVNEEQPSIDLEALRVERFN